ncbi:polyphenol oxidase family protein, partial [Candidatus Gracilibacteria bacterium]|nr:polyphenol oxidase family protein [Candidatus Gracilibacteria bacterium]
MNHNVQKISSKLLSQYSEIGHSITTKPVALRCPRYAGGDREAVDTYKQNLQRDTGVEYLIIADQTHSDISCEITQDNIFQDFWCDGLYTREKNIALFVIASDCVPILLYNQKIGIVGAIHAGRAGLENGIIQKIFSEIQEKYNSQMGDFQVYIGPHICQSCYEVGEGEVTGFREKYSACIQQNTEHPEK